MATESADRLDRLRSALLSTKVDRKKKLAIVKKLIELRHDPRTRSVLHEAAQAGADPKLLRFVVRAFGYLEDPDILTEIAPFLRHSSRAVAYNAVKAAVARDRKEAVRLTLPLVIESTLDMAGAVARVLVERCSQEALPVFKELAFSTQSRERLAALLFFRLSAPEVALPVVVEMLRRETDPEIYPFLARLVPRLVSRDQTATLDRLRRELADKQSILDSALANPAEQVECHPGATLGHETEELLGQGIEGFEEPSDEGVGGLSEEEIRHDAVLAELGMAPAPESEPVDRIGPHAEPEAGPTARPEPAREAATPNVPEGSVEISAATAHAAALLADIDARETAAVKPPEPAPPGPVSQDRPVAAAPTQLLPWQEKEKKLRERKTGKEPSVPQVQAPPPRRSLLKTGAWAIMFTTALSSTLYLIRPQNSAPPPGRKAVREITDSPLGKLGSRIKFAGLVLEINREYGILLVRNDQGLIVSGYFADKDQLKLVRQGKPAVVEGTLKEIKSERVFVVQGSSAREP